MSWGTAAWEQFPWGGDGSPVSNVSIDVSFFAVTWAPAVARTLERHPSLPIRADVRTAIPLPARHDVFVAAVGSSVPRLNRTAAYSTSISKAGSP